MNVAELIEKQARVRPEAPAIVDMRGRQERVLAFGELHERAAQLAAKLHSHGIEPGDGVLILHPMSAELYVFIIALFRLGAMGLFLDPAAGRELLERGCGILPPKAFFGSARAHLLRLISPAIRRIPLRYSTSWMPGCFCISSTRCGGKGADEARVNDDMPALITFTSGSTGAPKAVARSHRFLLAQYCALERGMELSPGGVDLTTLPIFALANLASGVTSVLPNADMRNPEFCDWRLVLAQIERHNVTSAVASPAFIGRLTEECERASRSLPLLEKVFIGGAPVFPNVLRRARKVFPNAAITAAYGSTEAEPMAAITLDSIGEEDFSRMRNGGGLLAGAAVPTVQLCVIREQWGRPIGRITAAEFAEMVVPVDQPGEIVASGEHVLSGYLRGEGDYETKFDVDAIRWHRTGDLGYFDSRNRLWLLGRCSAKIQDRRGVVYPFTVECAVRHDPRIACAALVAFRGQRVLVLQARDAQALDSATFKVQLPWASIDRLIAVKRIPMDKRHHAKVDYPELDSLLQHCG
jgi:olefin beta-lactone synthetase